MSATGVVVGGLVSQMDTGDHTINTPTIHLIIHLRLCGESRPPSLSLHGVWLHHAWHTFMYLWSGAYSWTSEQSLLITSLILWLVFWDKEMHEHWYLCWCVSVDTYWPWHWVLIALTWINWLKFSLSYWLVTTACSAGDLLLSWNAAGFSLSEVELAVRPHVVCLWLAWQHSVCHHCQLLRVLLGVYFWLVLGTCTNLLLNLLRCYDITGHMIYTDLPSSDLNL